MADPEQQAGDDAPLPVLGLDQLRAQIEARRAGTLSDKALAAWAFKQFYDEDMEQLAFAPEAEEEIRDVLDTLMFADDEAFALDDAALGELLERLRP